MKKIVFLLSVIFIFNFSFSQPKPKKIEKLTKKDVAVFINKTNSIIKETAKYVKEKQVYTGALAKAIDYQKKAVEDFKADKIKTALNNSSVARDFCVYAYTKNTENKPPRDWRPGPKYAPAINVRFTKEQIEKELEKMDKAEDEKAVEAADSLKDVEADKSTDKGKNQTK